MVSSSDILNADILIVDDQEANVRLLERMLGGAGYVSFASTRDPQEVNPMTRNIATGLKLGFCRYPTEPINANEFRDTLSVGLKSPAKGQA